MWLDEVSKNDLEANYSVEHVEYEIIGQLPDVELKNVVNCFKNSSSVRESTTGFFK